MHKAVTNNEKEKNLSNFFSRSSGKRHYARHDHGSTYYKRSNYSHGGILGWILSLLFKPKRYHSSGHASDYGYQGKHDYRRRHKSWS